MDDIPERPTAMSRPARTRRQVIAFARRWDRAAPVGACYRASAPMPARLAPERSTPAARVADRQALRQRPTRSPNRRIVSIADGLLGRNGRMVDAINAIGIGTTAYEALPFRLELE